jgi:hypothetical protein
VTLKLYAMPGTEIEPRLVTAANGTEPVSLVVHGMITYDYWSMVKKLTVRSEAGAVSWKSFTAWTDIDFPLALVVFGEVTNLGDPNHDDE